MTPWLSIIIPVRGKPNELWFTLQGLIYQIRSMAEDVEIVVIDNGNSDSKPGDCMDVCAKAGVHYIADASVQSPYHPRNVGAAAAKGEWLLFLDSHVLLEPGFLVTLRYSLGKYPPKSMVHFTIGFGNPGQRFAQYRMTVDENFWGTWGPTAKPHDLGGTENRPYRIAASGIWCFLTRKADWEWVGGFHPSFIGYAGGEVYLQTKYWLLGGEVLLDPRLHGVHYSGPRDYQATWNDRIRNVALASYIVSGDRYHPALKKYFETKGVAEIDWTMRLGIQAAIDEKKELERFRPLWCDLRELWARVGARTA